MGYAIQVGAFSKVENAARLVNRLNSDNLDAYYFLYKKVCTRFASVVLNRGNLPAEKRKF